MRRRYFYIFPLLFFFVFYVTLLALVNDSVPTPSPMTLDEQVDRLQLLIDEQARDSAKLRAFAEVELKRLRDRMTTTTTTTKTISTTTTTTSSTTTSFASTTTGAKYQPTAVLVIACNRPAAVTYHVSKLLRYRPSAHLYPIVISQDCDNQPVADAVRAFGQNVSYIKHESGENAGIKVPANHEQYKGYYMIARHYKLALKHVFETLNFSAVIITEDDLDIAEDFFEYFGATRPLLDSDRSLMCVSAWNDNGKVNLINTNSSDLLYRSDFFPGLGWMLTRRLWDELSPGWPAGFWDDWLRDPLRRQKRSCIRPEISRTSMTDHGKEGASKGLFFSKHLIKIKLSDRPFPFMQTDLSYLLKENYDTHFINFVYASKEVTIAELRNGTSLTGSKTPEALRLTYNSADEFIAIASDLGLMADFKAGVPRTAYRGIVSCFVNKMRTYIAPPMTWTGYDPSWVGLPDIIEK